jgi:hypothetical protein
MVIIDFYVIYKNLFWLFNRQFGGLHKGTPNSIFSARRPWQRTKAAGSPMASATTSDMSTD